MELEVEPEKIFINNKYSASVSGFLWKRIWKVDA